MNKPSLSQTLGSNQLQNMKSIREDYEYKSEAYKQMALHVGALYNIYTQQLRDRQKSLWVWNGRRVSLTEFASLAYGDTKQRTMFLLEYGDKE